MNLGWNDASLNNSLFQFTKNFLFPLSCPHLMLALMQTPLHELCGAASFACRANIILELNSRTCLSLVHLPQFWFTHCYRCLLFLAHTMTSALLSRALPILTHPPRPSVYPPSPPTFPDHPSSSSHSTHWSYTAHLTIKHGFRAAIVSCLYSYLTLTLTINFWAGTTPLPNQMVSSLPYQTVSSLWVGTPPLIGPFIILQSPNVAFYPGDVHCKSQAILNISQGGLLFRPLIW